MNDTAATRTSWELATEAIAVKMRWFGVLVGIVLVEARASEVSNLPALRLLLGLGAAYAAIDTYFSLRARVFLSNMPLVVSVLETVFLGLLCHFDIGVASPFRFYYMLSLVSCAIRYNRFHTYATFLLHWTGYTALALGERTLIPASNPWIYPVTIIAMLWVAWVGSSLAHLLRNACAELASVNSELHQERGLLEDRIAQRTRQLRETQASLPHQEKMAAFGLLAAGIAHEVGNPLASISSLVQLLNRTHSDSYTQEKLSLVQGQLTRIQGILRELVDFSRPASTELIPTNLNQVIADALNVAKYYKPTNSKAIATDLEPGLPSVKAYRDRLLQVFLNLILNAIDATDRSGRIVCRTRLNAGSLEAEICDDGCGIALENRHRVFQPHFTTKPNGTGLGLFVSKKIVEEMGGAVEFTSGPEGTSFQVRLPVDSAAVPPSSEVPDEPRHVVLDRCG